MVFRIILLVVGLLIIITRLPLVFWPKKSLDWMQSNLLQKKMNLKFLGADMILLSIIFIVYLLQTTAFLGPRTILASFFSIAILVKGIVVLFFPKIVEAVFEAWRKNYSGLTRIAAVDAMVLGVILVYLAVA